MAEAAGENLAADGHINFAVAAALPAPGRFDAARVEAAVRELLIGIGEDPDREGLQETPARVSRAYQETVAGLGQDPAEVLATVFDEGHDEMVLVRDINLVSLC